MHIHVNKFFPVTTGSALIIWPGACRSAVLAELLEFSDIITDYHTHPTLSPSYCSYLGKRVQHFAGRLTLPMSIQNWDWPIREQRVYVISSLIGQTPFRTLVSSELQSDVAQYTHAVNKIKPMV